jgi:hypothetical protein
MNPEQLDEEWTVDLSEVETTKKKSSYSQDPKRFCIPDGEYAVKVNDVNKEKSSSGNPMFTWDLEVCEGPHVGTKVRMWTVMTPQALWSFSEAVDAFGLGEPGQVAKFSKAKALGRRATANLKAEEWKEKWNMKVQNLSRHPDGPLMDDTDIPF